jgi:hypothetical protein
LPFPEHFFMLSLVNCDLSSTIAPSGSRNSRASKRESLLHGLKHQDRGFLIADRLRRDIKAIQLRDEQRSARTGSTLYLGDQFVVVEIALLVDVDPSGSAAVPPSRSSIVGAILAPAQLKERTMQIWAGGMLKNFLSCCAARALLSLTMSNVYQSSRTATT